MTENKRVIITRQYIATIISQKIPFKYVLYSVH